MQAVSQLRARRGPSPLQTVRETQPDEPKEGRRERLRLALFDALSLLKGESPSQESGRSAQITGVMGILVGRIAMRSKTAPLEALDGRVGDWIYGSPRRPR